MPTKREIARRQSVLMAALARAAGTLSRRGDLQEGTATDVTAAIDGRVGRAAVSIEIAGVLSVSPAQVCAKSSAVKPERIVAYLLSRIPERQRLAVMQQAAKEFAAGGLDVDDTDAKAAAEWLKQFRATKQETRAGSISFKLDGAA